jgi:hypothetical protein
MSRTYSSPSTVARWICFALLLGVLAVMLLLPALAHAQAPDPCAGPASLPPGVMSALLAGFDPLVQLLAQGVIASTLIFAALLWLRTALPTRLAPEPATESSRLWNLSLALLFGLLLGVATVAPAIPIPGTALTPAVVWVGRLLGGFLAATAAVFGRETIVRGQGVLAERKAAAAPAPLEPGK